VEKPTVPPSWSFAWIFPVVFVLSVALFAGGIYLAAVGKGFEILAAGSLSVIVVLVTWPLATCIRCAREVAHRQVEQTINPILERLEQFSIMLNLISEQQLISDRAKAVAFRDKDRDALRRAIQEEIAKSDWEAALLLAADIEKSFGSKQEADQFRLEIEQRFDENVQKQIGQVVAAIDRHVRSEQWQVAFDEAHQLAARFPTNDQARNMPQEVEGRRQQHKRQLIDSWHDAVQRKDWDGAIEILKKLDLYLTPTEAESFQETARGVFKEKLNNLRTQFSMAVQDHHWADAVRVGDIIIRDFPNTQMAKEVRESMDALRERAANPEVAEV
jgi:hypothetical protein